MTTASTAPLPVDRQPSCALSASTSSGWKGIIVAAAATCVIAGMLVALPGRERIAPVIIGDNTYMFLAADRLCEGYGLTVPPPRDPNVPWDWRCDWAFMTQWPIGYPLVLAATRWLTGAPTAHAAMTLCAILSAATIVGWFIVAQRCLPKKLPASLIAALAAGATFSIHFLVTPSSDLMMLAAIPPVLLLAWPAFGWSRAGEQRAAPNARWMILLAASAGALVWIRYAAVFVPVGLGLLVMTEWLVQRRLRLAHVVAYAVSSIVPVAGLFLLNKLTGPDLPVAQQYPLGNRLVPQWDWSLLTTAWRRFSEQPFYNHRPMAAWLFVVIIPVAAIVIPMLHPSWRKRLLSFYRSGPARMALALTASCAAMLIGLTFAFRDRFDYVGLERYYLPIRPFYFVLLLAPILAMPWRSIRTLCCIPLLMCCSWYVRQDWTRSYHRYLAKQGAVTEYGRRPVHFEPHSADLYTWLAARKSDDLLVFSNFYDDIMLETWIPACPAPTSPEQLQQWIDRVKQARGVNDLKIVFAIDLEHQSRRNMKPTPPSWISVFDLVPLPGTPNAITPYLYCPRSQADRWSS